MRPSSCCLPLLLLFLFSSPLPGKAQNAEPPSPDRKLRVFIDCQTYYCDLDYFRTEMPFVDHVRNRQDADVHILITAQRTGGGGNAFTLDLIGRGAFAGSDETMTYTSSQTATEDEVRQGLARVIKAGLMSYVASTSAFEQVQISYQAPTAEESQAAQPEEDPWNYWVFRSSVRGYLNGEEQTNYTSLSGSLSANRTTETWKTSLSTYGNYNERNFDLSDTETVTNTRRSYGGRGLLVRSLTDHWSVGGTGSVRSETYYNYDLALHLQPAVEYNVFPYAESTRRQLRFLYKVGLNHFNYEKITIFNKEEETLLNQELSITLDVKQPWGSIRTSLEGSGYLHDLTKNRLDIFSDLDLRLIKGLSLNLYGRYSFIHDQLYIAREGLTPEEILLQRRQLATGYRYYFSVGISYSFGSIYNNVVNARFGG